MKELDHDYIFDLRSAFWRGFFYPEKLFYSKFLFCFSFTGPTLDSRDHFLTKHLQLWKFGKKNANLRQLWTQLPNSVKFFYLTHRYVKKPISQCTVGAQIDTYIFALACMNIKDVHKHFITFNQHFCWLNMPADFMFFL